MALDTKMLCATLLADLCIKRAFARGKLGVFVEDVPPVDVQTFVAVLGAARSSLRVAILGGQSVKAPSGKVEALTSDPMEANRWRNDEVARAGTPTIVLVVGPAPKINSLRSALELVGTSELRAAIVARALSLLDTAERRSFWKAIERINEVSTQALLELAVAVEGSSKSKASLLDQEPKLVTRIGLLPSRSLFPSSGPATAKRAVKNAIVGGQRSRADRERRGRRR